MFFPHMLDAPFVLCFCTVSQHCEARRRRKQREEDEVEDEGGISLQSYEVYPLTCKFISGLIDAFCLTAFA
jgi:hypothetical protein